MGFIPENQIIELKERLDIVEIISEYVNLKRAGSNFKGLCPFHNEKSPSFMVSREKNNFHCFGCGEGGDTITFIMKIENLPYVDTLKFLADKIGMTLDETQYSKEKVESNKKLYEINSQAAKFYFKNFLTHKFPQEYLKNRGIEKKVLNKYFIGYAKNDNGLYKFLKEKNFLEDDMVKLGLIGKGQSGYYDKFRDRLIFPILNNKNKVIGFGGRTLTDHKIKYINSPESDIFIKGKNIYGVNVLNRSRIRNKVLLVEGYMDVIALYNHGIDYAIATLGTALTEDQARLIKRYGSDIYIAYDGDEAGIKATLRAIDIFKNMQVQISILSFPDKLDPDEFIKKYGKEKFEDLMNKAKNPIDFKLEKLSESTSNKLEFVKEIIDFLSDIKGNVIRDLYIDKASRYIGVTKESLLQDVNLKISEIEKKESYKNNNYKNDNFKNKNYGYNNYEKDNYSKNTYIDNSNNYFQNEGRLENRKFLLERELILYSLLDYNSFQELLNYSDFLENEKLKNIFEKIKENYNKNNESNILLDSDELLKEFNILEEYNSIKDDEVSNNKVIKELIIRIKIFKLETRRDELLELVKSNKANSEELKEYTDILLKLSESNYSN